MFTGTYDIWLPFMILGLFASADTFNMIATCVKHLFDVS